MRLFRRAGTLQPRWAQLMATSGPSGRLLFSRSASHSPSPSLLLEAASRHSLLGGSMPTLRPKPRQAVGVVAGGGSRGRLCASVQEPHSLSPRVEGTGRESWPAPRHQPLSPKQRTPPPAQALLRGHAPDSPKGEGLPCPSAHAGRRDPLPDGLTSAARTCVPSRSHGSEALAQGTARVGGAQGPVAEGWEQGRA